MRQDTQQGTWQGTRRDTQKNLTSGPPEALGLTRGPVERLVALLGDGPVRA